MTRIPQTLTDQLKHSDSRLRAEAVSALAKLNDPDRLPLLLDALCTEPDLNIREDITYALTRVGYDAVAPLIALLESRNPAIRHHAAHALGKLGHADAVEALIPLLADSDLNVALKAAFALSQIGDARAVASLVSLLGDARVEVSSRIADILIPFGAATLPALHEAAAHPDASVREQAIEIMGLLEDSATIPTLTTALQDAEWQVRFAAVHALSAFKIPEAHSAIASLADDLHPQIRTLVSRLR
jgi:HEAT repeat protein